MSDFNTRIPTGSSYQPRDVSGGQPADVEKAKTKKIEEKREIQQGQISKLEREEGRERAEVLKPDASKPVLDRPELPENMSTEELNELLTTARTKLMEGDPQATEALLISQGAKKAQTMEEQNTALYKRLNDNELLKSQKVAVENNGQVTIQEDATGQTRPLGGMRYDGMIQQMLLAILLQKLKDQRAEAAGRRQQFLQDQVANNVMQAINKQVEADKAREKSGAGARAGGIIGWIGAAVTLLAGIVTVNPGLFVGGLMAMTMMTLQQAKVMDKVTTAFAKALENAGMDPKAAQIFSSLFITITLVAASIGVGIAGGKALASLASKLKDSLEMSQEFSQMASRIAGAGTILVATGSGAAQTATGVYQYKAEKKRAEATKFEAQAQELDYNIQSIIGFFKNIVAGAGVMKPFSQEMKSQFTTLGGIYGNIA